ncbi:MAG: PD40 domain-containing protein, partial [bacterium]
MNKIFQMRYTTVRATLMMASLCVLLAMTAVSHQAEAEIIRRSFWDDPLTYVITENNVLYMTKEVWGEEVNIFDTPYSICMTRTGNSDDFFIIDKSTCYLTYFGTMDNAYGYREIVFLKTYGNGFGAGTFQYDNPEAITISHYDPCIQKLYILDSGNKRIQRLEANTCGWTISHVGYIFDEQNHQGYGPLNGAHDIDFCKLPGATTDMLVVADTDNHRLLIMEPDGTVIEELGGDGPGQGAFEFCYPYSVCATRLNEENAAAFIYVADRGNDRLVLIYQDENWNHHWYRVMDFNRSDDLLKVPAIRANPFAGFEDIVCDDHISSGVFSGIYVLDSHGRRLVHIDGFLETEIQTYSNFYFEGSPLNDLEACLGEMAVLCPYTTSSGLELFEIRASIDELTASPNPFKPPLEWTMVTAKISGLANMRMLVKDGGQIVDTLFNTFDDINSYVYAGAYSVYWDGTDHQGQLVDPGTYQIHCYIEDYYFIASDSKQIDVDVIDDDGLRLLTTHGMIMSPNWSPDGSELVFASRDGSQNSIIRKIDYSTLTETPLTDTQKWDFYPSWSPRGDSIVYARRITWWGLWGHEHALYIMDANGNGDRLVNDTTQAIRKLWDIDPKWIPWDNEVSYVKHVGDPGSQQIRKIDVTTLDDEIIDQVSGWIQYYSWAPSCDKIALSWGVGNELPYDVYAYDVENDYYLRLTEHDGEVLTDYDPEWSPDGQKILFSERCYRIGEYRWDIVVIPAGGGEHVPIKGSGDVSIYSSMCWAPDGTKFAFTIQDGNGVHLYCADYIRDEDGAFPAAYFLQPIAYETVRNVVSIIGTVADNISVKDTLLSELDNYQIEYGS